MLQNYLCKNHPKKWIKEWQFKKGTLIEQKQNKGDKQSAEISNSQIDIIFLSDD